MGPDAHRSDRGPCLPMRTGTRPLRSRMRRHSAISGWQASDALLIVDRPPPPFQMSRPRRQRMSVVRTSSRNSALWFKCGMPAPAAIMGGHVARASAAHSTDGGHDTSSCRFLASNRCVRARARDFVGSSDVKVFAPGKRQRKIMASRRDKQSASAWCINAHWRLRTRSSASTARTVRCRHGEKRPDGLPGQFRGALPPAPIIKASRSASKVQCGCVGRGGEAEPRGLWTFQRMRERVELEEKRSSPAPTARAGPGQDRDQLATPRGARVNGPRASRCTGCGCAATARSSRPRHEERNAAIMLWKTYPIVRHGTIDPETRNA